MACLSRGCQSWLGEISHGRGDNSRFRDQGGGGRRRRVRCCCLPVEHRAGARADGEEREGDDAALRRECGSDLSFGTRAPVSTPPSVIGANVRASWILRGGWAFHQFPSPKYSGHPVNVQFTPPSGLVEGLV